MEGEEGVIDRLNNQATHLVANDKLDTTKAESTFYSREELALLLRTIHEEINDTLHRLPNFESTVSIELIGHMLASQVLPLRCKRADSFSRPPPAGPNGGAHGHSL